MKIAVVGGGAAGFFSALAAKENFPHAQVCIYEKAGRLLSKVMISGGGRCNLTHACPTVEELCAAYPRGGRKLKKAFHIFNNSHTCAWFEVRGVPLVVQDDGCVFPASQKSQSIIDCFLREAKMLDIAISCGVGVSAVNSVNKGLELSFDVPGRASEVFDKVIVATGGSPKREGLHWLEALGHQIENPVPSLFTFNMPGESVTKLMGVVAPNAVAGIQGTKLRAAGPLLITHWGMSGPAIINLSSFGARLLSEKNYNFLVQINWVNLQNTLAVGEDLQRIAYAHATKTLTNFRPYDLPSRLWEYLVAKCGMDNSKTWDELGKKGLNKLVNVLTNDTYQVQGQTTFREEFVTCGGVSLDSIDLNTMQSKVCPNLYLAGEVLDIDGITGGYNFQSAWTTGFIAAKLQ